MPITVFSPHSGNAVKVRDQDAGRAVRDEDGRIFYVLPKSDGSGYYGAMTRSGNPREEARAKEFENKLAVNRGEVHEQADEAKATAEFKTGLRGKLLVAGAVVVVLVLGILFSPIGPLSPKAMWSRPDAPPPPREIPVDPPRPDMPTSPLLPGADVEPGKPTPDPQDPSLMVLPGGLKYKITQPGTGQTAKIGDRVHVQFTGWLSDSNKFDSTIGQDPPYLLLKIGAPNNLKFWNMILPGMTEGEARTVIVPPNLAYGDKGTKIVPGGETLKFDIVLLQVEHPPAS